MGHEHAHYWTSSRHNASVLGLEVEEQRPLMTSRGTGETKRSPDRDREGFITSLSSSSLRFAVYPQQAQAAVYPSPRTCASLFKRQLLIQHLQTAMNSVFMHKQPVFQAQCSKNR